jgi:hypothetical protein
MTLLNKLKLKVSAGEVLFIVSEVKCLIEPLQALNEVQTQAVLESLSGGDIRFACVNRVCCCTNDFWTGAKLAGLNKNSIEAIHFIKKQEYKAVLFQLMAFQWMLSSLIGNQAEVELDVLASEQNDGNPRALIVLWVREIVAFLTFYLFLDTVLPASFWYHTSFAKIIYRNMTLILS